MKKKLLFVLFTIGLIANMYGQSNVTNNNTITINGNVYFFRPATTLYFKFYEKGDEFGTFNLKDEKVLVQ